MCGRPDSRGCVRSVVRPAASAAASVRRNRVQHLSRRRVAAVLARYGRQRDRASPDRQTDRQSSERRANADERLKKRSNKISAASGRARFYRWSRSPVRSSTENQRHSVHRASWPVSLRVPSRRRQQAYSLTGVHSTYTVCLWRPASVHARQASIWIPRCLATITTCTERNFSVANCAKLHPSVYSKCH